MKYKIYKLIYNGDVVYIGRTKMTLKERRKAGYKWNEYLQSIRYECEMILIEETDELSRERYWIQHYGYDNLLNTQKGDGFSRKSHKEEWLKANPDYNKEYMKSYWNKNKDECNRKRREKYAERRRLLKQQKLKD
jgi:hypothetical protein